MTETLPKRYDDALERDSLFLRNKLFQLYVRLQLGSTPEPTKARMEAFGSLMLVGDPLADSWAERENRETRGAWYRAFNQALEHGLDAVRDPPLELVQLIRDAEREPSWLRRELLDIGCGVYKRVGAMNELVLSNLSLMGGYASAPIAKPLVFTGALETGTSRRLIETANFGCDVTRSGGLARYKPGFKTALRVRMMHGLIRKQIRNTPGWKTHEWGDPINQADMIVTNLATSYVYIMGCRGLGFRFRADEVVAYLHLWRYIGHLMGIDARHLPATEDEAIRTLYLALKLQAPPDEHSLALGAALANAPTENATGFWRTRVARLKQNVAVGFSRFALGAEMSRQLGVPDTRWMYWPLLFTPVNFALETLRRMTPGATRLAEWMGGRYQQQDIERRLGGREAAYVPAVALSES